MRLPEEEGVPALRTMTVAGSVTSGRELAVLKRALARGTGRQRGEMMRAIARREGRDGPAEAEFYERVRNADEPEATHGGGHVPSRPV